MSLLTDFINAVKEEREKNMAVSNGSNYTPPKINSQSSKSQIEKYELEDEIEDEDDEDYGCNINISFNITINYDNSSYEKELKRQRELDRQWYNFTSMHKIK